MDGRPLGRREGRSIDGDSGEQGRGRGGGGEGEMTHHHLDVSVSLTLASRAVRDRVRQKRSVGMIRRGCEGRERGWPVCSGSVFLPELSLLRIEVVWMDYSCQVWLPLSICRSVESLNARGRGWKHETLATGHKQVPPAPSETAAEHPRAQLAGRSVQVDMAAFTCSTVQYRLQVNIR